MSTLGIDFGTSFCSASYIAADGKPKAIRFSGHDLKMPSLVSFYENNVFVGYDVSDRLKYMSASPELGKFIGSTAKSIKTILNANDKFCGHSHREIVAIILNRIKRESERSCTAMTFDDLVLTHPANFEEYKKQLLKEAAKEAGFKNIQLLQEPVSAAIGFLSHINTTLTDIKGLLVYDFGAGTFDVAYVTKQDGQFVVPFTPVGDSHCGGDNIDEALYNLITEKAKEYIGNEYCERTDLDLLFDCRSWKEMLSSTDKITILVLSRNDSSKKFDYELTRKELEETIRPIVKKTITLTQNIVNEIKGNRLPLDFILLIGGSSNIPMVKTMLNEALPGVNVYSTGDADIAVALGASYYAKSPIEINPEKEWCYCMYDGKRILKSYKFCIYCGKPNFYKTGKF